MLYYTLKLFAALSKTEHHFCKVPKLRNMCLKIGGMIVTGEIPSTGARSCLSVPLSTTSWMLDCFFSLSSYLAVSTVDAPLCLRSQRIGKTHKRIVVQKGGMRMWGLTVGCENRWVGPIEGLLHVVVPVLSDKTRRTNTHTSAVKH